jgi:hypothetical protein
VIGVVNVIANLAWDLVQDRHGMNPQWGGLTVDSLFLAILLWLALTTDRRWLLFAAAFQVLSVVIYVARLIDPRVGALAPYQAVVIWSYLILASLAVGTWTHWRGRRALLRA